MKKILLGCLALVLTFSAYSNPIPLPAIAISELTFDSDGNWTLELYYTGDYLADTWSLSSDFDSIHVSSSSSEAKIKELPILSMGDKVFVINNSGLASDLTIRPEGDIIQVLFFYRDGEGWSDLSNPLIFGDYPDAYVRAPKEDESIANPNNSHVSRIFSIDASPSFGILNYPEGMTGTLHGNIYDKNNQLLNVANITFYDNLSTINIRPQTDGSYSTQAYSFRHRFDNIQYQIVGYRPYSVEIIPIDFTMEPGASMRVDIHLLDDVIVANEVVSSHLFKLYPNPVKGGTLNYSVDLPVNAADCFLEIVNANGQTIGQYPMVENNGVVNLPTDVPEGTYIVNLYINNKKYDSSKIVVVR